MEIDSAQQDLEHSLGELRDVLARKVDVRAKVERRIEAAKATALDVAVRGRDVGITVATHARELYRDQPLAVVGIVAGLLLVTGLALAIRHEIRAPA